MGRQLPVDFSEVQETRANGSAGRDSEGELRSGKASLLLRFLTERSEIWALA